MQGNSCELLIPKRPHPVVALAALAFTVVGTHIHFALTVALAALAFAIAAKPGRAYPLMEEKGICGITPLHALSDARSRSDA